MAKGATPRLSVLLSGPCSQKVAIISLLFQTSLCCSKCLHMVKDTTVLTSLAGIIIPSWQMLPLTWSCAVRPRNHLYLLQWGGDAAHSALSLLRQVSISVREGRKYFSCGCWGRVSSSPSTRNVLLPGWSGLVSAMCWCHDFSDHWGNGWRILCQIKHSKLNSTIYRAVQASTVCSEGVWWLCGSCGQSNTEDA